VSFEYKNRFLYFIVRPIGTDRLSRTNNNFIYCSGVNLTGFLPLTKGRHRLGQNPVEKGLQSVNHEVRSLFLEMGAVLKTAKGNLCPEIKKLQEDVWYNESFFVNFPQTLSINLERGFEDIINYAVLNLFKKIFLAMMLNEKVPEILPSPEELENYVDKVMQKYKF
jgi:hypothetical protein